MRLETVEDLRRLRAEKVPLFHVEYLPYLDFFEQYPERRPRGYGYGRLDDIYTTLPEAKRRFATLRRSGKVEELKLYQTVYDSHGGRGRRLLDEWDDRPADRDARKVVTRRKPVVARRDARRGRRDPQTLARLKSELMYARQDYNFWARQEHRLTRDEYAQKMKAERRVRELEGAVARHQS